MGRTRVKASTVFRVGGARPKRESTYPREALATGVDKFIVTRVPVFFFGGQLGYT